MRKGEDHPVPAPGAAAPCTFPESFRFRHTWRPYQARVLAELDAHLQDHHFHLVAAPGSGKTVVGLEALRRVGKPALVFAPTVAIRDQWIRRFLDSFWNEAQPPDWLSTDPARPRLLTVATYQSLTHFENNAEVGTLVNALEAAGVRTLVFDEAHHLRNQWWKTLDRIKAGLKSPFIVALTATPPYDVTQIEWNRYASICGEVDEEISAPELVKAKNLCPHQDFIYFCEPTAEERLELEKFSRGISTLLTEVALDEAFIDAVRQHPVLQNPADHIDELLADGDYYLSLAVYLQHSRGVAPQALLEVLGLTDVPLPPFNHGWAEVLFSGVLFSDRDSFRQHDDVVEHLRRQLSACGAIERRTILLRSSAHNNRLLRSSVSKLQSVADIVELESRTLDWRLRMLVLTDYIRDEDLPVIGEDKPFTKIGVVPIFEYLRKLRFPDVRLGVMTGRLAIVPSAALPALETAAEALGISAAQFTRQPLWHDPGYTRLEFPAGEGGRLLELGTRLFSDGHFNVLIGTAALLGEGWDAPAVNSLVMATVIGSYVSSNQIRGRAIRVDPRDEFKTATLWHLACIRSGERIEEPRHPVDERDFERETDDWTLLERRFRAFVGLRHDEAAIENGIERLGIDVPILGSAIASLNARMCREAGKRDGMADAWREAIFSPEATHSRVVHEVFVPVPRIPSHRVLRHWLRGGGWFGWLRARWLERKVSRIARTLLDAFADLGLIASIAPEVIVSTGTENIRVRLVGASCREESLFVSALREVFDPLQSPRYLLVTKDEAFAVPQVLAEKKERAESYARRWRRMVGGARLIYAHTPEGKHRLLRAKERYLASKHHPRTGSRQRWA
jgi:superfamily II DNA or RNA helicase